MGKLIGYREEGCRGRRKELLLLSDDGCAVGFGFGGKMSQEAIDAKVAEYKSDGWRHVESAGRLAFASEDGRWWHMWDCETGRSTFIDAVWLANFNKGKCVDECKSEEHGTI